MTPSADSRVYALLGASAALAALVSDRIYPDQAPQQAVPPFVVFQNISETPITSCDGVSAQLTNARIQIDCYAREPEMRNAIAAAVAAIFDSRVSDPVSYRVQTRNLFDDQAQLYRASMDFLISAKEQ